MADDGYVLEWRNFDAGANPFASNMDAQDQAAALHVRRGEDRQARRSRDANPPKSGGALLPRPERGAVRSERGLEGGRPAAAVLRERARRPRARPPTTRTRKACGRTARGPWSGRARSTSRTPTTRRCRKARCYNFGFAVHDDNITTRGHHVSFPVTVGFGAKADDPGDQAQVTRAAKAVAKLSTAFQSV